MDFQISEGPSFIRGLSVYMYVCMYSCMYKESRYTTHTHTHTVGYGFRLLLIGSSGLFGLWYICIPVEA